MTSIGSTSVQPSRSTDLHRSGKPHHRLRELARVHVYDEIDDVRVHEALTTGLPDLDAFATAVARLAC